MSVDHRLLHRVQNFALYGSQHYYRVVRDPMMHELEEPERAS